MVLQCSLQNGFLNIFIDFFLYGCVGALGRKNRKLRAAAERDLSHRRGPVLDLAKMFTNETIFIKTLVRKILAMFLYVFAFQIVLDFTGALRGRRVYKKHTSRAVFTKCLRQKKHCGTIIYIYILYTSVFFGETT